MQANVLAYFGAGLGWMQSGAYNISPFSLSFIDNFVVEVSPCSTVLHIQERKKELL